MTTAQTGAGIVVEFAGLPGVGKTTLAATTHAALVAAGVTSRISDASISAAARLPSRVRRRLVLAGADVCRHPLEGAAAMRAIRRLAPDSSRDAVAGAVQWFAVQALVAREPPDHGVHLLEEGQLQTLWTLALRARGRPDDLLRLMASRAAPGEHPVVVVDAPLDLVSARLAARGSRHSRTQLLPDTQRTAELVAGRDLLRDILAASDRPYLLVVNDGQATPEELGRRVTEWVLRAGAPGGWGSRPARSTSGAQEVTDATRREVEERGCLRTSPRCASPSP